MQKTVYFDNAATTWPKPDCVIKAVTDAMKFYGGNPGRGTHKLASAAEEILFDCRQTAADMFRTDPGCVVFTMNATHALNLAIKGLAHSGCHILIDNFAHNASYRPALALRNRGCSVEIYDASGSDEDTLEDIEKRIRANTGLVIATHKSNICSKEINIEKIGELCRKRRIHFIVDASQSAGTLSIDAEKLKASALCMPGHKGLYGPMGSGILICDPEIRFSTLIEGGAGINSKDKTMPEELPERLEAGTVALPAIAGLRAGMTWVMKTGIDKIRMYEKVLSDMLVERIRGNPAITLHGPHSGSVLSLNLKNYSPSELSSKLNNYGVCVRSGYHCSPLAHRTLSTDENGTVRVSFSYNNTASEVKLLADILNNLSC